MCSTWFEASQGSVWLLLCCYTVGTGILLLQARWSLQCEAGGLDSSAVSSGRQGQSSWHRALQARPGWAEAGLAQGSAPIQSQLLPRGFIVQPAWAFQCTGVRDFKEQQINTEFLWFTYPEA